jgi:hypothetical protein
MRLQSATLRRCCDVVVRCCCAAPSAVILSTRLSKRASRWLPATSRRDTRSRVIECSLSRRRPSQPDDRAAVIIVVPRRQVCTERAKPRSENVIAFPTFLLALPLRQLDDVDPSVPFSRVVVTEKR